MEPAPTWIGIDVSKDQLDVAVGVEGPAWSVPNDDAGIEALTDDLRARLCALVVLEATGGLKLAVTAALAPGL